MLTAPRPDLQDAPELDVNAFGDIHVGRPACALIGNLNTRVEVLGAAGHRVPATINFDEPDNTWVCSPYSAYCSYAIEEIRWLMPPGIAHALIALCQGAGVLMQRAQIDKAVAINNWLLSTNLYPELDTEALDGWIDEARQRWPDHAVWFRSLNDAWTPGWIAALGARGAVLLPSRQVYLYSDVAKLARERHNLALDFKLLAQTTLRRCDDSAIEPTDYPRIEELYSMLYLKKYSRLNPAYRASFVAAWHRAGLLRLTGFRDAAGILQAVVGLFERDGVITAPLVGYDTSRPQRLGLYRLLMAATLKYAADAGKRVNLSAGAAGFKRLRGGVPAIEYSAVLMDHLPRRRRRLLSSLGWLTRRIGVPVMKRFQL